MTMRYQIEQNCNDVSVVWQTSIDSVDHDRMITVDFDVEKLMFPRDCK